MTSASYLGLTICHNWKSTALEPRSMKQGWIVPASERECSCGVHSELIATSKSSMPQRAACVMPAAATVKALAAPHQAHRTRRHQQCCWGKCRRRTRHMWCPCSGRCRCIWPVGRGRRPSCRARCRGWFRAHIRRLPWRGGWRGWGQDRLVCDTARTWFGVQAGVPANEHTQPSNAHIHGRRGNQDGVASPQVISLSPSLPPVSR
jgi:hypothetical protein